MSYSIHFLSVVKGLDVSKFIITQILWMSYSLLQLTCSVAVVAWSDDVTTEGAAEVSQSPVFSYTPLLHPALCPTPAYRTHVGPPMERVADWCCHQACGLDISACLVCTRGVDHLLTQTARQSIRITAIVQHKFALQSCENWNHE